MSDFGFDGHALDGTDAAGDLHPLEIARDLIASGKPRSALEVLSLHFDTHVDDFEYLLLCAAAWRDTGDTLRAQQALLGAARVAPADPRPLRSLSELLEERGEREKADRVLAKARMLELAAAGASEPVDDLDPDDEEDLIAAAERREKGHRPGTSPRRVSLAVVGLGVLALLIAGISLLAQAGAGRNPSEQTPSDELEAPAPLAAEPPQETEPAVPSSIPPVVDATAEAVAAANAIELPPAPLEALSASVSVGAEGKRAADAVPSATPRPPKPAASRRSKTTAVSQKNAPPPETELAAESVSLDSSDTARLTEQADMLYAQGQTALAASYYRRALEIDADYAPALVGMGRGILRAEKYDEAMSNATRALQLARGVDARPGLEAEAIYQMGRVHLERGDRDAARQLLRQSVSLSGAPDEAWFYLGEALASDNSPAARRAYEKYLELETSGQLADRARRAIQ